jgi:hypothetical protein
MNCILHVVLLPILPGPGHASTTGLGARPRSRDCMRRRPAPTRRGKWGNAQLGDTGRLRTTAGGDKLQLLAL